MSRIEQTIISNFFYNEEYTRRVLPFVKLTKKSLS